MFGSKDCKLKPLLIKWPQLNDQQLVWVHNIFKSVFKPWVKFTFNPSKILCAKIKWPFLNHVILVKHTNL